MTVTKQDVESILDEALQTGKFEEAAISAVAKFARIQEREGKKCDNLYLAQLIAELIIQTRVSEWTLSTAMGRSVQHKNL